VAEGDALHALAALPGVGESVAEARAACTALRWHEALRRRTPQASAEASARAARASAALEGAELPLDLVRDALRGARELPEDPVGRTVSGALRATVEAGRLGEVTRRTPAQALARLHTAAAAGLVPDDSLGRPRRPGEPARDLGGPARPAPDPEQVAARLDALAALLTATGDVPALVLAAVAQAEVLVLRPFVVGNGVVARALFRAVIVDRALDPTGVGVPEVAFAEAGLPAYGRALAGYATGSPDGVAGWLRFCADAVTAGAAHGRAVADAVLAGRLSG
jgi:Fic family protein